jgi:MoaA/NifB/PqqE/SkfB family radical SAM enzyme
MELRLNDQLLYHSTFDPATGNLVRAVEIGERYDSPWDVHGKSDEDKAWKARYGYRHGPFSPSPELVDIAITDKCYMGCTYCYQDSRPKRDHAPKELVEKMIQGFDYAPYQVAIGGGEPTLHPDLPYILRRARELGSVPNYTTAGDQIREDVIEATNEVCGGVAMTYHSFKGIDWFVSHYQALRDRLKVQLNVHLIADKDVATNLLALCSRYKELGRLRLVLLAYYPDVGRASMDRLLAKRTYMKDLPEAIKFARVSGFDIAFSEGLLPFFLSRPGLGVETKFAMAVEGKFSCYFDTRGRIAVSSFDHRGLNWERDDEVRPTVFTHSSQSMWDKLWGSHTSPRGDACYDCAQRPRCATPHDFHYFVCAFAQHNQTPLREPDVTPETAHDRVLKDDEVI